MTLGSIKRSGKNLNNNKKLKEKQGIVKISFSRFPKQQSARSQWSQNSCRPRTRWKQNIYMEILIPDNPKYSRRFFVDCVYNGGHSVIFSRGRSARNTLFAFRFLSATSSQWYNDRKQYMIHQSPILPIVLDYCALVWPFILRLIFVSLSELSWCSLQSDSFRFPAETM